MSASYSSARRRVDQRIKAIMAHTNRYAFDGISRLARDVAVSPSAICRVLSGKRSPSFSLMAAITEALEKELGRTLDPRELMTFSGQFKTPSVCTLCGCSGCLPEEAYMPDGTLKPEYRDVAPGQWVGMKQQDGSPSLPMQAGKEEA